MSGALFRGGLVAALFGDALDFVELGALGGAFLGRKPVGVAVILFPRATVVGPCLLYTSDAADE